MCGRITRNGCSQGARAPRSAHVTRNVYCQLSELEDVVFNDFIRDDFIPEGDAQIAWGSASLPDPVALETEERRGEAPLSLSPRLQGHSDTRKRKNERDVLEALGENNCDAGMSVENVPAVVNIKTLMGRFIAHKFSTRWVVRNVLQDSKTKQGRLR